MKPTRQQRARRTYYGLLIAAISVLAFGTVFYRYMEGWSWVDAYYFCVTTLTTIGYGNFVPQTTFGKLFTTVYIFVGIGIIAAFLRAFLTYHGKRLMDRYHQHRVQKDAEDNHKRLDNEQ